MRGGCSVTQVVTAAIADEPDLVTGLWQIILAEGRFRGTFYATAGRQRLLFMKAGFILKTSIADDSGKSWPQSPFPNLIPKPR